MEKKLLPHEEMVRILELLEERQFSDDYFTSMDGYHEEIIRVYDESECVQVVSFYDSDDCKHSIERPDITYTYEVDGYTILVDQDYDGIGLSLKSDEYQFDKEDEAYAEIKEFFDDELGEYDDCDSFSRVRWAEWTEDELFEEILDGLECDEYIRTKHGYKGIYEGVEEWLDDDEIEEYKSAKRYTPEEVARALAQEGCPDPSC